MPPLSSSCYVFHLIIIIILTFFLITKVSLGITITIANQCDYSVWPGILPNAGSSGLGTTGFHLPAHDTRSFQAEPGWSGRFWGRTACSFDSGSGRCATGDCGTNQIECNGAGAAPPATLAEFTIGSGAPDFYDVSLVDGYNLPMVIEPGGGGSGACGLTGCVADLNRMCPNELRAGDGQGCKSACGAFGLPEYCCREEYGSPATCRPSAYSEMFKNACPRSYSYAFDDATSTFTCTGSDYTLIFCPSLTSQKSSKDFPGTAGIQPPAAVDDSDSGPEDDITSWLSNLVSGGPSRSRLGELPLVFKYFTFNICTGIIVFTLLFLQL
ncbi:thaumatin-like protein 1 [Andrographis paniculata]|uniref:thaumatin-like protein 1 n=1 Tax=Andrographis paniculata TaxID=175694 RepID=UPI0021E76AEC|nr:thaumatin-like protein 1 [Andrographis paniculata]